MVGEITRKHLLWTGCIQSLYYLVSLVMWSIITCLQAWYNPQFTVFSHFLPRIEVFSQWMQGVGQWISSQHETVFPRVWEAVRELPIWKLVSLILNLKFIISLESQPQFTPALDFLFQMGKRVCGEFILGICPLKCYLLPSFFPNIMCFLYKGFQERY